MTLLCFISWGFTVILLELDEDLDEVFLLGLYEVYGLDLLWSLEWVKELLHEDDLQCGVSWQWVLEWWCHEVSLWWHLQCNLEQLLCELFWLWLWYLWECDCDLDLLCRNLSWRWCLEVYLVLRVLSLMVCKHAWWWYSIWTVHCYMTIFIAFKAMYIWATMCHVAQLLTLEALVFLIGHYINCRWG